MLEESTDAWTSCPPGTAGSPAAETARLLAEVLAEAVGVEQVPGDSNFFDDLGADSLVMAGFCARVRKRADLPPVSMKDVYRYPTANGLASALTRVAPQAPASTHTVPAASTPVSAGPVTTGPASIQASTQASTPVSASVRRMAARAGTGQYLLCGMLQFLVFLGYSYLAALATVRGFEWVGAGSGVLDVYLRSVLLGSVGFAGLCGVPIVAKWTLIGRFTSREFSVWTLGYVRWWLVKTLIRTSPVRLFTGSPLYSAYLRALGAKIGRDVAIFSTHVPVCVDLLTIGDGTVVRKDAFLSCYRAHDGLIQTGPVTLGRNVHVSEQTVLDINTSMGDRAQLGHASSLHAGQSVPAGERWHGSPAEPTGTDFRTVGAVDGSTARKLRYTVGQLLALMLVHLPLAAGCVTVLLAPLSQLNTMSQDGTSAFATGRFYLGVLAASFVLFFGAAFAALVIQGVVPRLLHLAVKPDTVYPLYGFHYGLQRAIALLTNRKFFTGLFGDSSAIVHYLRYLGYDLFRVTQTGSNFGSEVKHDNPFLTSVGSRTMVADGLSVINAEFSNTSFRLSRVSIGARSFLGNHIAYPSRARTGDNCLLATKVMVPVDGEVRENVGLLGSPPFAIPRTVMRDTRFQELESGGELRRRLAAKNRHNAVTAGLYLMARWIHVFAVTLLALGATTLYPSLGASAFALAGVLTLLFSVVYFALLERAVTGFKAQKPLYCSIYEPSFWRHERFWKMASVDYVQFFDGTPFKNLVWRLLGARIGKRVFDDGCFFPERSLVTIGDDCTLNAGTVIQCHSQEDGAFKSDRTTIGDGCTLGVGALVHYGVTLADRVQLACDSFLMKGEQAPQGARWAGNPARQLPDYTPPPTPPPAPPPAQPSGAAPRTRTRSVASDANPHRYQTGETPHGAQRIHQ
ncbi:Pls/PosA family non-ribosomal peptide synthetase [Streptomyces sp. NBC_01264]|uniref:Pls/PosA family non-ribosomal peptide synthetase n=1 Tax=Streptomyces sp. NBC_01264 TaxID=2903804 RepID=UPI00225AB985|nr:Pls/PosA family non-ribosomal peptide synthetase [Streptomyces sp. NBC_01264]MCX4775571.1 DapH/DapD/GlmU-related protein [Streptomyces sp. NBC_01264]